MSESNPNPYAPPQTDLDLALQRSNGWVDGDCLVVYDQIRLPRRCVVTNQEVDEDDMRNLTLEMTKSFRLSVNPPSCKISFGVSKGVARRSLERTLWLTAVATLLLWTIIWWFIGSLWVAIYATPVVFAVAFNRQKAVQLQVTRFDDGWFWVKGLSPIFLAEIQEQSLHQ